MTTEPLHENLCKPPGDRLAFLHIPKTAGTSLAHALATHWGRVKIIGDSSALTKMGPDDLKDISLFSGHFYAHQLNHPALAGFTPVTVLRDPLARLFSEYRFAATSARLGQPLDSRMEFALKVTFFEYAFSRAGQAGRHAQLYILGIKASTTNLLLTPLGELFENAKETASLMRIGVTENLGAFVEKLFAEVDAPAPVIRDLNTQESGEEDGLTLRQRETLREVLAPDYALYNLCREQMHRWLDQPPRITREKSKESSGQQSATTVSVSLDVNHGKILSRAREAFDAKDYLTVCQQLSKLMANQVTPASLKQFATAALELNHQQFLAQVVRYSIMADLSIQERLDICNVFRFSNRPQEAWEIFIAGYHFLDFRGPSDEHLFIRVTFFLVDLCNNPTTPDRLRELVWHYVRRMKNIVEEPFKPAPIQFAKNEVVTLNRGPQTRILGSDRLPRKSVDDYNDQAERFDAWRQRVGNPSVREFRNVFVNRLGQIWRPDGKIIRDNVSRIPMASHEAGAFARRIPVACLAINRYGGNFHHWMADLVPSLAWRLQEGAKDIPLIISDNATDFMRSSLAVLGISPSSLEEAGDAVFVECLYDGETTGPKILPDGAHRSVLERFREEADRLSGSDSLHAPLVYISRRDSKIRALSNEEALEKAVAEIGFRVLQFGSLSLLEQIAAIRHAKFVLGPHGAGFTHILFSRPETHFFEITPYQPGSAQNRYCMARLSRIMGNHHTIWLEPVDSATGAWSASIEQIVKIVAGLIPLVDSSAEV